MAEAKRIPVEEYKVQLTLTRTEARLVHKLVGCIPSPDTFVRSIYRELEKILGNWGGSPSTVSEFPVITEGFINAGYKEP